MALASYNSGSGASTLYRFDLNPYLLRHPIHCRVYCSSRVSCKLVAFEMEAKPEPELLEDFGTNLCEVFVCPKRDLIRGDAAYLISHRRPPSDHSIETLLP
jgi:hypothetical protein